MTWMKDRPDWWPAWTNYPHSSLSESRARELSRYCVSLEETLLSAEAAQREALDSLDKQQRCTHCGGPETTDKDCMCGGTGNRLVQIKGLEGCIQYWRKEHREALERVKVLEAEVARLRGALVPTVNHVRELEEAWRRGALSSHDGMNGWRSNRNVEVRVLLCDVLAQVSAPAAAKPEGDGNG